MPQQSWKIRSANRIRQNIWKSDFFMISTISTKTGDGWSNRFFNTFMKWTNEKRTVFRFPFFMKMKNEWQHWKLKVKTCFNMKVVVILNFVFHIEVTTKSNHKFLNSVFQFIKNTKWHFGYTDYLSGFWYTKTNFHLFTAVNRLLQ